MAERKTDLTLPRNFANWAIYGLAAVVSTVSGLLYYSTKSQLDSCQEENNFYARESFKKALTIEAQKETIKVQDTAIVNSINYINDSIQAVNVKNFKGEIKIKQK